MENSLAKTTILDTLESAFPELRNYDASEDWLTIRPDVFMLNAHDFRETLPFVLKDVLVNPADHIEAGTYRLVASFTNSYLYRQNTFLPTFHHFNRRQMEAILLWLRHIRQDVTRFDAEDAAEDLEDAIKAFADYLPQFETE